MRCRGRMVQIWRGHSWRGQGCEPRLAAGQADGMAGHGRSKQTPCHWLLPSRLTAVCAPPPTLSCFFQPCCSFVCPTEIIAFSDRAKEFEALNCQVSKHRCHVPLLGRMHGGAVLPSAVRVSGWSAECGVPQRQRIALSASHAPQLLAMSADTPEGASGLQPAPRHLTSLPPRQLTSLLATSSPCSCWRPPPTPPRCTWPGSRRRASGAASASCRCAVAAFVRCSRLHAGAPSRYLQGALFAGVPTAAGGTRAGALCTRQYLRRPVQMSGTQ